MKRCIDSCLPQTIPSYYSNTCNYTLVTLPEDLLQRIFALLSRTTLSHLSLVSKYIEILTKTDPVWRQFADTLLFPQEIMSKPPNTTYKDYCRDLLSLKPIGTEIYSHLKIGLKLRDPALVEQIKQIRPPNFKLLNASETRDLISQKDTINLLNIGLQNELLKKYKDLNSCLFLHSAAKQQVGEVKYEVLNFTDYMISFDEDHKLLIDDRSMTLQYSDDCQFLIWMSDTDLHIFSDVRENHFVDCYCNIFELLNLVDNIHWTIDNSTVLNSATPPIPERIQTWKRL
jgi:F-box associated protein